MEVVSARDQPSVNGLGRFAFNESFLGEGQGVYEWITFDFEKWNSLELIVFFCLHFTFSRAGQSHNNSYHLFRMKDYASPAIQAFAESAHARTLQEELARQNSIIYDEFHMAKIPKGAGSTQGTFFVDGRHHKVSFITKIIPSPDWFIGLDSYDVR